MKVKPAKLTHPNPTAPPSYFRLGPVTDEWKKQHPKYRGKDRYEVTYLGTVASESKNTARQSEATEELM